jgi:hypothetical protein
MQIQIQSSKISDFCSDDYEYCLLQICDTLHLPTELHGSSRCRFYGTSNPNERFESINICVVTGTHYFIFQKTGISTVTGMETQFSRKISKL